MVVEEPVGPFPLSKVLAIVPNLRVLEVRIQEIAQIERDNIAPPSHDGIIKMHLPFIEYVGWRPNGNPALRGDFPSLRHLKLDLLTRFLNEFMTAHPHLQRVDIREKV